jgi:hypothetical protein
MAGRGGQPGAERLELVMQALLERPAVSDQPPPVADRPDQRLHGVGGDWPAGPLADQPDQRRTIAVVGLVRRREPSWARAAWVSEGANSRTDPGQRRSSSVTQA